MVRWVFFMVINNLNGLFEISARQLIIRNVHKFLLNENNFTSDKFI